MLYRLEGIAKSFGGKDVLEDATWQHDPGRVVGLVGRNGAGKTTVLRIASGVLEPDAGRVLVAGGTTFATLDQAVEPEGDEKVREFVSRAQAHLLELESSLRRLEEAISIRGASSDRSGLDVLLAEYDEARERFDRAGGYEAGSRVERVLSGIGLDRETWDRPVGHLSGGQKHRAQIARLLLTGAPVLLLDEPTNHLDVQGIEFLEEWLVERRQAGGAALVVSHDRAFLNAVADRILEVAHGRLEEYPGDYEAYRRLKAERDRLRAKVAGEQRRLVERTEDFIRRNIAGQKTKQAQARRKMLARLEHVAAPLEDSNDVTIRFEEARASGDRVLETRAVVPGYAETGPLLAPLSFLLRRGERVALWGPNGCGKTTLLKTLARVVSPLSGAVSWGTGVLCGYYDQEMSDLPAASRALDAVMDLDPLMREEEARDFLALFDFRGDEVFQRVATLSGGEKGRLSLARIVFGGANLLLLDEPTNHLDLDAREQLEDALSAYEGAIVFVSHDRWFVDRIATHVLEIRDGAGALWPGGYEDLVRRRKAAAAARADDAPERPRAAARPARPERAVERRRERMKKRLAELEGAIAALEQALRDADASLADPGAVRDGNRMRALKARRENLGAELDARLLEWEEAGRTLEAEVEA